jgi:hypothetical protein
MVGPARFSWLIGGVASFYRSTEIGLQATFESSFVSLQQREVGSSTGR